MTAEGIFAVVGPVAISAALVLTRIGALFLTTPVFNAPTIPTVVKAGIVGVLTVLVMITTGPAPHVGELSALGLAGAAIREAIVGGVMGLAVAIVFGALAFAGQLFGVQMGFAIASVVDPATHQQVGVLGQLLNLLGMMLFLLFNGHLMLIGALFDSFTVVPLGMVAPNAPAIVDELVRHGAVVFSFGLRIALPVACVVLLVNVGLATIARTVPQVNIFVIGFMITISLGLLLLAYSLPYTARLFEIALGDAVAIAVRMVHLM